MNLFFYFIGDSLRHTVLSKQLFETESADIKFCNLITYTFSASKVISHSEVEQNITNVSDLRNYCPLWPVLRLGRTKNITKTKRFPPNYVGPVKTWLKSNGYEIIGFFFCDQFCDQDKPKMLQRRKDFLWQRRPREKFGWNTIALIYQWLWPFNVFVFPQRRKGWFIEGNHLEMSLSDCLRPDNENLASQ